MPDILDLLRIDRRFESSVNLLIDRGDLRKIEGYIPLASSVSVLKRYLLNAVNNTSEKSTMLIGPYGKGKSHLLLVLSGILERLGSRETYKAIKEADSEAGELIDKWFKHDKRMLTVVLSNTGEPLNQTFMLALYEAVKRIGHEDIMPDTYYMEAVKTIDNWRANYPDTYEGFVKALLKTGLDTDYFIRRLKRFDERCLERFRKIYPTLTSGSTFNPMINMSVVSIYSEMNRLLCERYGYAGMLVIFDEFSKYIEGNTKESVSVNMKIIQDFCELANHSSDYPIHAVFVAHKSIREYRDVLPEKIILSFKGIEGRLKEILYVSSEKNNYGLINQAVKKQAEIFETIPRLKEYIKYQQGSRNLPCFGGVFTAEEFENAVIRGCYPINPAASYMLLRISEKIGQNERTLFTYMAKDEPGSMIRQLKGRGIGEEINAGDIYDYFENLFKDNGTLPLVHNEWIKADFALAKAENEAQRKVIKSLALMLMINRAEELPAGRNSLMYASGLSEMCFDETIKALIDRQLIVYRERTKEYSFKNNIGIDLFKEVKNEAAGSFAKIELIRELKNIIELRYLFPRKYNVDFTMTRFFEYEFINSESFFAIENTKILFNKSVADGRIIVLMDGCNLDEKKICAKLNEWKDPRIMAVKPYESFDKRQSVKYLLAVQKLLSDESFTEDNKVLIQELKLYEEDLLFEINTAVSKMASPESGCCSLITMEGCCKGKITNRQFNKILSEACKLSYKNAPRINNEQINRRKLTNQIKKARGRIIKSILEQEDFRQYDNGKSPEAAIFRAVFYSTGILGKLSDTDTGTAAVLKEIKKFIESCSGEKKCFAELYDRLEGMDFGVRRGVIPIFLAFSFAGFQDMPFIYFSRREVMLDDDCLSRINEAPENYYLLVEESSAKKNEYLKSLEEIFAGSGIRKDMMSGERLAVIADAAKRWYRGLARYTMNVSENEWKVYSETELDFTFKEFDGLRKIFRKQEINPREIIFDRLPVLFGCRNICDEKAVLRLMRLKQYMENYIDKVKLLTADAVSMIFDRKGGNLCVVLKNWYLKISDRTINGIYSLKQQELLKIISGISGCDEIYAVELLAKASMGIYIEDWSEGSGRAFLDTMEKFYRTVSEASVEAGSGESALIMRENGKDRIFYYSRVDESSTGVFLKNAIEEVMDEFGEGIGEKEKISVLVDLLNSITGGRI